MAMRACKWWMRTRSGSSTKVSMMGMVMIIIVGMLMMVFVVVAIHVVVPVGVTPCERRMVRTRSTLLYIAFMCMLTCHCGNYINHHLKSGVSRIGGRGLID